LSPSAAAAAVATIIGVGVGMMDLPPRPPYVGRGVDAESALSANHTASRKAGFTCAESK
jgi:hypothetical protein